MGDDPRSAIRPARLDALRTRVRGPVLRTGDLAYHAARSMWNGMIDRHPAAIVRCHGAADVIAAVDFADDEGLPLSIRGGAHNVAGRAVCDGGLTIYL